MINIQRYLIFRCQHDHILGIRTLFENCQSFHTCCLEVFFFPLNFFSSKTMYLVILSRKFLSSCFLFMLRFYRFFFNFKIFCSVIHIKIARLNLITCYLLIFLIRWPLLNAACVQYTVVNIKFWLVEKEVGGVRKTN